MEKHRIGRLPICLRMISASLAVTFFAFFLFSCKDQNDIEFRELEELLNKDTEDTSDEKVFFASRVYIVIPKSCSGELSLRAAELADKICEKTGVGAILKYDDEDINMLRDELEILVGMTDRLISAECMKSLRYGDYICRWERGSILLGGRDDKTCMDAISEFESKILHGASSERLMGENAGFEKLSQYRFPNITLCGYDLYDYSLAYQSDMSDESVMCDERYVAELLAGYIAEQSGYVLPVVSAAKASGKTISLGIYDPQKQENTSSGYIEKTQDGVNIGGSDAYGLSSAVYEFIQRLFTADNDGSISAVIQDKTSFSFDDPIFKVCSVCSLGNEIAIERVTDIIDRLHIGQYDIITFGLIGNELCELIGDTLPDANEDYKLMPFEYDSERCLPVIYNSDIFDTFECGFSNSVLTAKAVLKDGREYLIIRTLYDGTVSETELNCDDTVVIGLQDSPSAETVLCRPDLPLASQNAVTYSGKEYGQRIFLSQPFVIKGGSASEVSSAGSGYKDIFYSMDIMPRYNRDLITLAKAS